MYFIPTFTYLTMSTRRAKRGRGQAARQETEEIEPALGQQTGEPTTEQGTETVTTALIHNTSNDTIASVHNSPARKTTRKTTKKPAASNRHTVNSLSVVVSELSNTHANLISNLDKRITDSNDATDRKLDRVLAAIAAMDSKGNSNANGPVNNVAQASSLQSATPAIPSATACQPPPATIVSAPPAVPRVNNVLPVNHGLPPPTELVRHENRDGHIDALLDREDYAGASSQGKPPASNDQLFMKPYMFIEREGVQTIRQKLDLRASLSMIEYISCTLALLRETDAYSANDLHDIIRHLGAVAIDAMVRPWPSVRRWSQHIWDLIERGRCKWSDYQIIQDERFRLSYMNLPHQTGSAAPTAGAARTGGAAQPVANSSAICRDFNSINGCRFSGSHEEGNVKYVHVCAHCDSTGKRSSHPYHKCRSRLDNGAQFSGGHDNQHDNRYWQGAGRSSYRSHQPTGGPRQHTGGHNSYDNQPKNA